MLLRLFTIVFLICPLLVSAQCSRHAHLYHAFSGEQTAVALGALVNEEIGEDEQVVQIGCRTGRIAAHLAERVPQGLVVAWDEDQEMTAFCRRLYGDDLYNNLVFEKIKESDRFDHAFSFSDLHHHEDPVAALRSLYDVLKPNGRLLATVPGAMSYRTSAPLIRVATRDEWAKWLTGYPYPRKKYSPEEWVEHMIQAGFSDITVEEKVFHYAFANRRELIDWFRAFSPIMEAIPSDLQNAFLVDLAHTYLDTIPPSDEGMILFEQPQLTIKAVKELGALQHS